MGAKMVIWLIIATVGALLVVLPLTMGLIGIVAAAVVWVILFLVAAFTVHRGGSGFLGEWRAGHLTCVVALPLVMMICVYILPGIVGF